MKLLQLQILGAAVLTSAMCAAEAQDRALHDAVRGSNLERVKELLVAGADVNAEVVNGLTPIYFASDPRIVELLLTHKPRLDIRGAASAQTPLEHAAESCFRSSENAEAADKFRKIVAMLREAGADYTIDAAIYLNDVEHIRSELEKDDSWVNKSRGGQTVPLRVAARTGRAEISKLLLKHKADVDAFEEGMGEPIVRDAIAHPTIVKLLIDHGANLRRRITWQGGRTDIWLVGYEATALHVAVQGGNLESVRVLVEAGLDVNAADVDGNTPLHIALKIERFNAAYERPTETHLDVMRFLLENDASLRFKDKEGRTPLDVARRIRSPRLIRSLLREHQEARERSFIEANQE